VHIMNIDISDTDFNPVLLQVSGATKVCKAFGVPSSLLLPIIRWDAMLHSNPKSAGKAPAIPDPGFPDDDSKWVGCSGWESGHMPSGALFRSDVAGGNAGLLLGMPDAVEPSFNLQAVDIDLNEGCETHRDAILAALQPFAGDEMVYRETVSYRALLLVNVAGMDAGRKHVWHVTHNGTDIGKVEWLTTGEQCVIAGRHHSGNWIKWRLAGEPEKALEAPPLSKHRLATYPDCAAVLTALAGVWEGLRGQGYEFPLESAGTAGTGGSTDDLDKAPEDLRPSHIANAFDRMTNSKNIGRDLYKDIMLSAGGTMKGIAAHRGTTQAEETMVAEAAARWAARWEGRKEDPSTAYEAELLKWWNDWRRNSDFSGWRQFKALTVACGIDLGLEEVREAFTYETWEAPEREKEAKAQPAPDIDFDGLDKPKPKPPLKIEFARQFIVTASMPLIDGWIDEGELVAMIGAPQSYKTTITADMVGCIAHGIPWMDCRTERGSVLVVELEGAKGFRHRCIAWHKAKGLDINKAPIGMSCEGVTLACGTDGEDVKRVIDAAQDVAKHTGLPLRMIVVDTLARVMGGKDEDKAADISYLVQAIGEIQRQTGVAVMLIHHTGHADKTRGRGSSNQRASWDVDLLVEANNGFGTVKAPKQREKEKRPTLAFAVDVVEIGHRPDGKAITACVTRLARPGEGPTADKDSDDGLSKSLRIALGALQSAINKGGKTKATMKAWRAEFYSRVPTENGETKDKATDRKGKAFKRAYTDLQALERIVISDDYVWLAENDIEAGFDFEDQPTDSPT
jgi:hypothetical protein